MSQANSGEEGVLNLFEEAKKNNIIEKLSDDIAAKRIPPRYTIEVYQTPEIEGTAMTVRMPKGADVCLEEILFDLNNLVGAIMNGDIKPIEEDD